MIMIEDNEYSEIPYKKGSPVDIAGLIKKVLKSWKTILIWMIVAGAVGVFIGFCSPKVYTVTSKLSPELTTRMSGNSLSSLASMAGVNLSSLSGTSDAIRPDLYPEIISSVPFIIDLFEVPVQIVEKKDTIKTSYYDYIENHQKRAWWSVVMGWPFDVLNWAKGLFSPEEEEEAEDSVNPVVDSYHLTKKQDGVVHAIEKKISTTVDRKTYMITIVVEDQDKVVAADISNTIIENLKRYITNYRTAKARRDLEYYQGLYNDAKADYLAAQREYAWYFDSNHGTVSRLSQVKTLQLQNEMNLKYSVYSTASQQLELAKAKVQQETPVLAVLQPPTVPLKGRPSKVRLLITYAFFGFFLSLVWVLWLRNAIADFKKKS